MPHHHAVNWVSFLVLMLALLRFITLAPLQQAQMRLPCMVDFSPPAPRRITHLKRVWQRIKCPVTDTFVPANSTFSSQQMLIQIYLAEQAGLLGVEFLFARSAINPLEGPLRAEPDAHLSPRYGVHKRKEQPLPSEVIIQKYKSRYQSKLCVAGEQRIIAFLKT